MGVYLICVKSGLDPVDCKSSLKILAARNLRAEEARMDREAYEKADQAERLEREARALDEEAARLEREARQGGSW